MTYCSHGINHAGERHGCDGCCCPGADIPSDYTQAPTPRTDIHAIEKERDDAKALLQMAIHWSEGAYDELRKLIPHEAEIPGVSDIADEAVNFLGSIFTGEPFKALRIHKRWRNEIDAEKNRADMAESAIKEAHDRLDDAGGIPNRDPKLGELTLRQRVDMLANDFDLYEGAFLRAQERATKAMRLALWCHARIDKEHVGYIDREIEAIGPRATDPRDAITPKDDSLDSQKDGGK